MGVAAGAIALTNPGGISPNKVDASANPQPQEPETQPVTEQSQQPSIHRHTITVNLTSMNDLKVKEGDRIKAGDVISDRTQQRQQLAAKKQQLEIAISQMSLPLTMIAKLPEPNLEQEQVAREGTGAEGEVDSG